MKKYIFKLTLKSLLMIIIVFLVFSLIKYKDTSDNKTLQLDIPIMQISKMTVLNGNTDPINLDDIDLVVLYNEVFVPLDETFLALFNENYIPNKNQTITFGITEIIIDVEKNEITIPNYYIYSNKKMDNTVVVEIEEYNHKKYIPIYLISNIGNITVKLDGVRIYNSDNYISSFEVIKRSQGKHNIYICVEKSIDNNDSYFGQSQGSLWREEALKRIEKYRKEEIKLIIKNQNNLIINNANISISMDSNDFKWGTAIQYANLASNDYNRINNKIFNMLGSENGFKWSNIYKYGYNRALDIELYAITNNMYARGHCLWWDYICSTSLKELVGTIDNPIEGTMAYVYKNYSEGKISREEAETLSIEIQKKFETIVLNHIEEEINKFTNVHEWDVVNEILTMQCFKIFLYDRLYLTDSRFLNGTNLGNSNEYISNDEYYIFLAKCFNKARETCVDTKLVLNDNIILADMNDIALANDIKAINKIERYTDNIDSLGIQYHIFNRYYYSPQSYYNNINSVLNQTNIKDAVITEYSNCISEKRGNYTAEERQLKADYLRDTLISVYSNPNISEFCFWVYNSTRFDDEEREAYEKFVTPLLNYYEEGISGENGYTTRLYKGEYTAKITLQNGKEKDVKIIVNDDSSNYGEIIFESDLVGIDIGKIPDSMIVYRGDDLNLSGGIINAYYDDNTVEQINMNDLSVGISGFDKNIIGRQTITLMFDNKSVTLDVNVVENLTNIVENIKNSNSNISKTNSNILKNENIYNKCELLNTLLNALNNDSANNNATRVNDVYDAQFKVLETILDEYNNEKLSLSNNEIISIVDQFINISDSYKILYSYYIAQEPAQINEIVINSLNELIGKFNSSTSIGMAYFEPIIQREINIYQSKIRTNDIGSNCANKLQIIKLSDVLSNFIEKQSEKIIKSEKELLNIIADKELDIITNENITVTLKHGQYTKVLNNNGKDTYTFTQNGSFTFEVKIGTEEFGVDITVRNIDKSDINYSNKYKMDSKYVTNIDKNTSLDSLIHELRGNSNYVVSRNGIEINNSTKIVATGDVLKIGSKEYIIIITGDVNCDGKCTSTDLLQFRRYLIGTGDLTETQKKAVDFNDDGKLTATDLMNLKQEVIK